MTRLKLSLLLIFGCFLNCKAQQGEGWLHLVFSTDVINKPYRTFLFKTRNSIPDLDGSGNYVEYVVSKDQLGELRRMILIRMDMKGTTVNFPQSSYFYSRYVDSTEEIRVMLKTVNQAKQVLLAVASFIKASCQDCLIIKEIQWEIKRLEDENGNQQ